MGVKVCHVYGYLLAFVLSLQHYVLHAGEYNYVYFKGISFKYNFITALDPFRQLKDIVVCLLVSANGARFGEKRLGLRLFKIHPKGLVW